jgi:hypothetical protein
LSVHTGGGGKQVPAHPLDPAGFKHVSVDQDVVARDTRQIGREVPDPTHIGRKVVDLIDAARCSQAIVPATQIEPFEIIRGRRVHRLSDIDTPHPETIPLESSHQVLTDEATGSGNQDMLLTHAKSPVS